MRRLGAVEFRPRRAPGLFRDGRAPEGGQRQFATILPRASPAVGERRIELRRGRKSVSVGLLPVAECNDPEVVRAICLDKGGLAALPRFLVAPDLAAGRLETVLPGWRRRRRRSSSSIPPRPRRLCASRPSWIFCSRRWARRSRGRRDRARRGGDGGEN